MLALREHYGKKEHRSTAVKAGDIVLMYDDNTPRMRWRLAKVTRLITGRDGVVRAAELQLAPHGRHATTLTRSVHHLVPIEVQAP